jgi:hypothetical protein
MDEQTDAAADLAYIRGVMERSRSALGENGLGFWAFGLASVAGTGLSYLLGWLGLASWIWLVWCVGFGGVSVLVFRLAARRRAGQGARAGRLLGAVWGGIGTFVLVACLLFILTGRISLATGLCLSGLGLALGFFLSGTVSGITWMRNLSLAWVPGSAALLFLPELLTPLAFAGLVLVLEVVPGFILQANHRRQSGNAR